MTDQLQSWAAEGEALQPRAWDQMPDIYLYMDQVVTCLQGMLKYYDIDPKSPLITNSMINNYVKYGAVERPIKKKYSREHLAKLPQVDALTEKGYDVLLLTDEVDEFIPQSLMTYME